MSTEKLEIEFGVNNAALRSGLEEARSQVAKFRGQVGSKFATVLAGAGIGAAITSLVTYAAKIADLSEKFDVSTDTLQRWGLAAETNASSSEALAAGFNKLIIAQSKAQQGDAKMIEDFGRLGVTIDDLRSLDAEGLMRKMATGTLEAATVTRLLGDSALELVPTLRAVADGSAEMGSVIKEGTIRSLAAAEDKIKDFNNRLMGVKGSLAEFAAESAREYKALYDSANVRRGPMSPVDLIKSWWEGSSDILAAELTAEQTAEEEAQTQRSKRTAKESESAEKLGKLRERIADMRAKGDLDQMGRMEKIAALDTAALALVAERDALGAETEAGLQKQVEIEEARLAIQRLLNEVATENVTLAEKERKEREAVAEQHEKELKEGKEKLAEEQGRLAVLREEVAGRDDVARRLEQQIEFQGRIRDIEEQIAKARDGGNTALVNTLQNLRRVVSEQQTLASDVAREALARNGGQAPSQRDLRQTRRDQVRSERRADTFRKKLVDGLIPTARNINGVATRGIDPVTGEERAVRGGPEPLNVFDQPDPRAPRGAAEMIGPQLPGGKPGGDLQRPGDAAKPDPSAEVVSKLENVISELKEIRKKVEPALNLG